MKKMKIGLVCPYNIHKPGGVQEVIWALKDGLEKRGHEVRIITPFPRNHKNAKDPDPHVIFAGTSTDFRTLSFSDTTSQVSSTADNDRVDEILAEEKFDVLHFHEPWMPLLSRQLLQRSNAVNIATFHSKVADGAISRSILKIVTPYLNSVMKYLHELTAVSPSAAGYVSGLTDEPIAIIPNGIDLKKYRRKPAATEPEQKSILFVGRLERRKGVTHLLQAFQLFSQSNPDVKLIIAGDGPDREKLELLAEDLKLKNASFLGFVSEELKLKLLAEADIFCSPALFGESFGIVLLEAMATSTVTVAGNNSGYVGVMQGLGAVSIVSPQDTQEFARRLDLLMHEESLRKLWQKWAKEHVKQFNYPIVVEQYEELYKEALKQHGHKV